jgi:hypothetical protein
MSDVDIYYFDGDAACELCSGVTGYTIAQAPQRPHSNCDCAVETIDPEDLPSCRFEIREITWTDTTDTISQTLEFENCDSQEEAHVEAQIGEQVEEDFDDDVREAAEAAGWEEPEADDVVDQAIFNVPGLHVAELDLEVQRYSADFKTDVWLVCQVGGEEIESEVGEKDGHYEKNVSMEVDFNFESCPDVI